VRGEEIAPKVLRFPSAKGAAFVLLFVPLIEVDLGQEFLPWLVAVRGSNFDRGTWDPSQLDTPPKSKMMALMADFMWVILSGSPS
jgi:hypothetical protein